MCNWRVNQPASWREHPDITFNEGSSRSVQVRHIAHFPSIRLISIQSLIYFTSAGCEIVCMWGGRGVGRLSGVVGSCKVLLKDELQWFIWFLFFTTAIILFSFHAVIKKITQKQKKRPSLYCFKAILVYSTSKQGELFCIAYLQNDCIFLVFDFLFFFCFHVLIC